MTQVWRASASLVLLLPVALCLWIVYPVLIPVALAALFAVMIYPLLPRLRRRLGRAQAAAPALLVALASLVLLLPMGFVAFTAVHTLRQAADQDVSDLRDALQQNLTQQVGILVNWAERLGINLDVEDLRERAVDLLESMVHGASEFLGEAVASAPDLLVSVFLFFCGLYTFLASGSRLMAWLRRALPLSQGKTGDLFEQVRQAVRGVVLGSILTGLVQSALCLVALLALKVPGAFVWSVLALILSFLPVLGTTPVTLGAAAYLLLSQSWWQAAVMVGSAVVIGSVDNAIRPWVQGAESNLHPLLSLMAIFGGLEMMGPAGIFLGPVIAATAQWGVETYTSHS